MPLLPMMLMLMMMMMLVMLMQIMMMTICVWQVTQSRACHMLPRERLSHTTQKECEGVKGEATTVSVGSSYPEQEGLGLETCTSEV